MGAFLDTLVSLALQVQRTDNICRKCISRIKTVQRTANICRKTFCQSIRCSPSQHMFKANTDSRAYNSSTDNLNFMAGG
jgi:hypothetical protein